MWLFIAIVVGGALFIGLVTLWALLGVEFPYMLWDALQNLDHARSPRSKSHQAGA
jgi:hypothetical protein